ncbi:MAG: universal stress protein [Thiobacillaceae bacterium]|jgi:nucleotide-binding universal stress UspA family protein
MTQIEHIVVPVDDWELADSIIDFAANIAREFSAKVSLMHVAPDVLKLPEGQQRSELAKHENMRQQFRNKSSTEVSLRMGDAADEIVKFAILEHASLIAMPTHGRQGIDRIINGSVTENVLRQSPVPVLMSNEPQRTAKGNSLQQIRRILLPLYTCAAAEPIMPILMNLAKHFDAEVVLYHDDRGINDVGTPLEPQEAVHAIEESAALLDREGIRHSTVRATAKPLPADILGQVKDLNIDLVVMTTHARSGLMRGVFGSVTETILRHSPSPVLSMKYSQ